VTEDQLRRVVCARRALIEHRPSHIVQHWRDADIEALLAYIDELSARIAELEDTQRWMEDQLLAGPEPT
jgi:hypothetical protein